MLGFFKTLFHRPTRPIYAHLPIAGLSYYRAMEISNLMRQGDMLDFENEADNPHDENAVMVLWNRNKIGYVPSQDAKCLNDFLKKQTKISGIIVEIDPSSGDSRWVKINVYPKSV